MNLDRKYRPNSFDEYVGNKDIVRKVKSYLKTGDIPTMMFIGEPGCGKNTLAYIIATQYFGRPISLNTGEGDPDYKELNASKDRGIDIVRDTIVPFLKTKSEEYPKRRILFLDEFDSMTKAAQLALKDPMEKYSHNCLIIMSLNDFSGIKVEALKSRSAKFFFKRPSKKEIYDWFMDISQKEGVQYASEEVPKKIVTYYKGDLRNMLIDCLQALSGYKNKDNITMQDISFLGTDKPQNYAEAVAEAKDMKGKFFGIWKKNRFDERRFLEQLFQELDFAHPKTFATVDARLREGCNPMIQLSYLFEMIQDEN